MDLSVRTTLLTSIFIVTTLYALCLHHYVSCSETTPSRAITLNLIHRDFSPQSPYFDPAATTAQKHRKTILRSPSRLKHLFLKSNVGPNPVFGLPQYHSTYMMNMSIGSPSVTFIANVEIGNGLMWIQCEPCQHCFDQPYPIFDPSKSTTYEAIGCNAPECNVPIQHQCRDGLCEYATGYPQSGSFTVGTMAKDMLAINTVSQGAVTFRSILFGCGHFNQITKDPGEPSGIIGFGPDSLSLLSQIDDSIGGKFSYCTTSHVGYDPWRDGRLYLGSALTGTYGVVVTPLITKDSDPSSYYLHLISIWVGEKEIKFDGVYAAASPSDQGNIIIDLGTALTYLSHDYYVKIETEVIANIKLVPVPDPEKIQPLCYNSTDATIESPSIIMSFAEADVELGPPNRFVKKGDNIHCFTFVPGEKMIYGGFAQGDFVVGYDRKLNIVSFKRTSSCPDQLY